MAKIIWQACWPALLYGILTDFASSLLKSKETLSGTFAGAFLAIPLFGWLYGTLPGRTFDEGWEKAAQREPFGMKDGIFCIAAGIGGCGAVNTLLILSPLPRYFTGFAHTAGKLYGASFAFQAGAMGMIIPAAEELVFRGLVFGGLRREHPFYLSACLSAAVFGVYHGNVLQGIYGGVMGLVLAWGMEKKRTIRAPVLIHMAANLTSVILTSVI